MRKIIEKGVKQAKDGVRQGKDTFEKMNIKQPVVDAASKVGTKFNDALDIVAGDKRYNLVQEHIELQKRYNDILALKLDEALTRIARLEDKLKDRN